ncbi:hypothetical protein [Acidilutibacter cellobiosedens]|uniref:hypothetical protein n=1 Tax=Acidilutibacter cellobiosedens TaxID=2507161 RepID=UPI0014768E09|nr:hypothetical protein [Acidilutibacter cellobiosedens]
MKDGCNDQKFPTYGVRKKICKSEEFPLAKNILEILEEQEPLKIDPISFQLIKQLILRM